MTAGAMQQDRQVCLEAGMDDYVSKPIRVEELVEALTKCGHFEEMARDGGENIIMETLNPAALENLRGVGEEGATLLIELVDMFLQDAALLLVEMRQGIERGDAETLNQTAHILKSSCAMFGAMPLSGLFRELEARGADGQMDGGVEKMARVEAEYEQVEDALLAVRRAELANITDADARVPG